MAPESYMIFSSILLIAFIAWWLKKIDLLGALVGILIAILLWHGAGITALLTLFIFFISGTLATSWYRKQKEQMKIAQEKGGKRGTENVIANGGVAAILSLNAMVFPESSPQISIMILGAFSTACSDTLSSELGNIYGHKYYDILTFKPAQRGLDGVISINGLFFGLLGSALIGTGVFLLEDGNFTYFSIVTFAGLCGNIADSYLGATLQRRGLLNNHQVNFFATTAGSLTVLLFYHFTVIH